MYALVWVSPCEGVPSNRPAAAPDDSQGIEVPATRLPVPPYSRPARPHASDAPPPSPPAEAPKPNAIFDESGNFLLYPTLLGIKARSVTGRGAADGHGLFTPRAPLRCAGRRAYAGLPWCPAPRASLLLSLDAEQYEACLLHFACPQCRWSTS